MAHLRSLVVRCDYPGCSTRASEAIYTWRNEHHLNVCKRHAPKALAKVEQNERAYIAACHDRGVSP